MPQWPGARRTAVESHSYEQPSKALVMLGLLPVLCRTTEFGPKYDDSGNGEIYNGEDGNGGLCKLCKG
eukprot:scaffold37697_cov16-Tisochrysis_lutea.AAC.1